MKRFLHRKKRTAAALVVAVLALTLLGIGLGGCSGTLAGTDSSSLQQASVVRVVDGDTLVVNINGEQNRVRLIGIDTPESVHPDASKNTEEGADASEHVKEILPAGTTIWLEKDTSDTDKYDRLLRYVWLEKPNNSNSESEFISKTLNAQLVSDGWAVAKRYEPDTKWASVLESLG